MPSNVDRWTRELVRRGVSAGVIEGSDAWLVIGAVTWLARLLWRRPVAEVHTETLRLGETIVVSHVPAPPRTRRAKRKAARRLSRDEARAARAQAKREASRRYQRQQAKAAAREAAEAELEAARAVAEAAALERRARRSRKARRAARKANEATA